MKLFSKVSLKDIIKIGVIAILSFPLLYVIMLFAVGSLRIVFVKPHQDSKQPIEEVRLLKQTAFRDSLAETHMVSYHALQRENEEVKQENERLKSQQERIAIIQQELERERNELAQERERLEKLVSMSEELKDKKIKQISRVYGAMRPAEAAHILETIDDDLVVKILTGISDDRQRGKIMSALPTEKAKRITRKMGM